MTEHHFLAISYGIVLGLASMAMTAFVMPEDAARAACIVILSAVMATGIVIQLPRWR